MNQRLEWTRLSRKVRIVAGIPALNEERTIAKVIVQAMEQVDTILVVDDGSKDETSAIAKKLGAVVLKHTRNLGKGAALRDCFNWAKRAGADVLVTIDADGQHDPADIPRLVAALERKRADVVIGSRLGRPPGMPRHRWMGARTLDAATGVRIDGRLLDSQSGLRAYSRNAIENLVVTDLGMGADAELIMRANGARLRIVEVSIRANYGGSNTSKSHPVIHGLNALFGIIRFTSIQHPLTFYGGFAFVSFVISLYFGFKTIDYFQRFGKVLIDLALVSIASGLLAFVALFTGVILFTLIGLIRERQER